MDIDLERIRAIENVHAGYLVARAAALGGTTARSAGVASTLDEAETDAWYANRILCAEVPQEEALVRLLEPYRDRHLSVRVDLPVPVVTPRTRTALERVGLTRHGASRVVVDRLPSPLRRPQVLEVAEVRDTVTARAFWEAYRDWFGQRVGGDERTAEHVSLLLEPEDGIRAWLAHDADGVVGIALLALVGQVALLADAATRPDARRRGVHVALIGARLEAAAAAGARVVTSEVEPGGTSDRSLRRAGLRSGYAREVWLSKHR